MYFPHPTDQWEYNQIIRYENGISPMEYRKATIKKKDENTLSTSISGLGLWRVKTS